MTSTFEESVLDFDINLFQHSSNNAVGSNSKDKIRKAIFLSKRKMMATDSLVRKYYDKRLAYRALERCLLSSKDEYKQACIETMEYREKYTVLQDEIKKLKMANSALEDKCVAADNHYEGMQSHAKQLQQLVKENEIAIESLKIENQLEKANSKDIEKHNSSLQKENDNLIKNICLIKDVIFGKKKITKELKLFLNKYGKSNDDNVSESEETNCDNFDSPMSPESDSDTCSDMIVLIPPAESNNKVEDKLQSVVINEENMQTRDDDHDSECSNEVVSSDTGRGSSLAFSDSDKCFNSPDYFNHHSPAEVVRQKEKITIDIATSPIPMRDITESPIRDFTTVSTSPIIFDDLKCSQSLSGCLPDTSQLVTCPPVSMIDRVLSPIFVTQFAEKSTSPINNIVSDTATSTINDNAQTCCNNSSVPNTEEKLCLELNNSNSLQDENSNDDEIQMIFDAMRFNQNLITPIPTTPAKSKLHTAERLTGSATQAILHSGTCLDAAKAMEENIGLQAKITKLEEEFGNIKNMLSKLNLPAINKTSTDMGCSSLVINDDDEVTAQAKEQVGQNSGKPNVADNMESSAETRAVIEDTVTSKNKPSKLNRINRSLIADYASSSPSDMVVASRSETAAAPCLPEAPSLVPTSPIPLQSPTIDNKLALLMNTEDNSAFKEELRLQSEIPSSVCHSVEEEEVLTDYDAYEHEIVIELGPDCPESDRYSLHELLKEQSTQQRALQKPPISKPPRAKKRSKLQKLRKKMLPKSKIKKVENQVKAKRRLQPTRLISHKERNNSDVLANNKTAYERARKVMAEINSKKKVHNDAPVKVLKRPLIPRRLREKQASSNTTISNCNNQELAQDKNVDECNDSITQDDIDDENLPLCSFKSLTAVKLINPQKSRDTVGEDISKIVSKPLDCKLLSSDLTARTRSQSKIIDHKEDLCHNSVIDTKERDLILCDSRVTSSCTPQTPPTLRMYSRIRSQRKSIDNKDDSCYNSATDNINLTNTKVPQTSPVSRTYDRTRSKSKSEGTSGSTTSSVLVESEVEDCNSSKSEGERKRLKRPSVDKPNFATKRMLRSSTVQQPEVDNNKSESALTVCNQTSAASKKEIVSYDDMDIFEDSPVTEKQDKRKVRSRQAEHPKFGILCAFLDKYGKKSKKQFPKQSENASSAVLKKLEESITEIQKINPKDTKTAMDELVTSLLNWSLNQFLMGLIKYLQAPERKIELYNKMNVPPAPPMTKTEQILIYVVSQLKVMVWPDIVENILKNIEYVMFSFNHTPEFDVIETMSHFYAVLCRYAKNRNRLRLFIIDAMYCLSYKAVPVIRQCLDVWMHILPLAHMGVAKNPLVTSLVYLLHFYKCEDKFNRVQEIRNILNRKYFYDITEWNETRILEMFRNSIIELRDNAAEKKMLRIALIILAKRHGARWCHNHIIKKMLQPMIEQPDVPARTKHFCVALLGPLMKPYPVEMKVNCEIVMNQLFDLLNKNPSKEMEEAIFTSLIYMSKHNQNRVISALLFWKPENVSKDFEELLINYVKERPKKSWRMVLSRVPLNQT